MTTENITNCFKTKKRRAFIKKIFMLNTSDKPFVKVNILGEMTLKRRGKI